MKAYDEYGDIRRLAGKLREKSRTILERVSEDVAKDNLMADKLILDIFNKSELIATSDEIYSAAQRRTSVGNPPAKTSP